MTSDQFDRFMAVQVAQLAATETIANNLASIAATQQAKGLGPNWDRVKTLLDAAKKVFAGH